LDAIYLFVIAAVVACFGIALLLRSSMEQLAMHPENISQIQTRLFMFVAFIEALPIVLIVFGFMTLAHSDADLIIPLVIVLASVVINAILNLIKRNELAGNYPEVKSTINSLFLVGNALMAAIPVVAIVAMFVR
jgi:F0F1-type ATP synthase membrane subunit c/vacuolar-type H+-ATPase subunit K